MWAADPCWSCAWIDGVMLLRLSSHLRIPHGAKYLELVDRRMKVVG
jgi:hypothetical protein